SLDRRDNNPLIPEDNGEPAPKRPWNESRTTSSSSTVDTRHEVALDPERRDMGSLSPFVLQRFICDQSLLSDARVIRTDHLLTYRCSRAFKVLRNMPFNERCKITKDTLIRLGPVGHAEPPLPNHQSPVWFAHQVLLQVKLKSDPDKSLVTTTAGAPIP
ncbi:hypothetical protein BGZ72_000985, partial [Mortierella alpina]